MVYYHVSPIRGLKTILPMDQTGVGGMTDPDRDNFRDVVFLYDDVNAAFKLAGYKHVVYYVEANAVPYANLYSKKASQGLIKGKTPRNIKRKIGWLRNKCRHIYTANSAEVLGYQDCAKYKINRY